MATIDRLPTRERHAGAAAATVGALGFGALLLYAHRLGDSPMFLYHDEVFFGVQAHAIATTGRDTHGRLLPF